MKRVAPTASPRDPNAISIEFPEGRPRRRGRRPTRIGPILALLLLAGIILAATVPQLSAPTEPTKTDRQAPDFVLPTDDGSRVSPRQFAGSVLVIHFVVLVCCSGSAIEIWNMLPVEAALRDDGVAFLAIAIRSPYNYYSPEEFRDFFDFNWTLALDFEGVVQARYGAEETSTFAIDEEGVIRWEDRVVTPSETLQSVLAEVV